MKFPPGSAIDEVDELHADPAYYDGYTAGMLLSEKRTYPIPPFDEALLLKMEDALKRRPEAADEISLYIRRLKKIAEVMALAREAESDGRGLF